MTATKQHAHDDLYVPARLHPTQAAPQAVLGKMAPLLRQWRDDSKDILAYIPLGSVPKPIRLRPEFADSAVDVRRAAMAIQRWVERKTWPVHAHKLVSGDRNAPALSVELIDQQCMLVGYLTAEDL